MRLEWLRTIAGILAPYRAHLCEEVDYLRAQLAQRQRRVDELQEALIDAKAPPVRIARSEPAPPPPPLKPRGWEEFRRSEQKKDAEPTPE
jgi:hypothetical protein